MKVLAVPGSLRDASSNAALVRAIAKLCPHGASVEIYGGLGGIPPYSPDAVTDEPPATVADLRARVEASESVLICTPEYAHGMPGVLKNALDWLVSSGELYRKPVAALSASPSHLGGHRALAWLNETLGAQQATVPARATFAVPFVRQVVVGDTVVDQELAERLRSLFEVLDTASRL